MPEVGRRGSVSIMYEVVISLILLGLFAAVTYTYIADNADGAQYFSKFYAVDLGTSAELVNAGAGDVVLRYDHLKPTLDLSFWFINGAVVVAKTPEKGYDVDFEEYEITALKKNILPTDRGFIQVDYSDKVPPANVWGAPTTARQFYGHPISYPQPGIFENPTYLALRKVDQSFSITPAEIDAAKCPGQKPSIPLQEVLVFFEVEGLSSLERERAKKAFNGILEPTKIHQIEDESKATIVLKIKHETGSPKIEFSNTNTDGQRLACFYTHYLQLLSFIVFEQNPPGASGQQFALEAIITTDADTQLQPEILGRALAYALARLYG